MSASNGPGDRSLTDAIRSLLDRVDALAPDLTSVHELGARQFAAAALLRGSELARSASLVNEQVGPDPAGILARSAWESWLTGTFLLFGGNAAFLRMEAEAQRQETVLLERNSVPANRAVLDRRAALDQVESQRRALEEPDRADAEVQWNRLSIEVMARAVGPWIEDTTGESADVTAAYDLFYRSHSTFDAHGIRPLERLVTDSPDGSHLVLSRREPWIDPDHAVAIASMYLGKLGVWIADDFGVDSCDLSDRLDTLVSALNQ